MDLRGISNKKHAYDNDTKTAAFVCFDKLTYTIAKLIKLNCFNIRLQDRQDLDLGP